MYRNLTEACAAEACEPLKRTGQGMLVSEETTLIQYKVFKG